MSERTHLAKMKIDGRNWMLSKKGAEEWLLVHRYTGATKVVKAPANKYVGQVDVETALAEYKRKGERVDEVLVYLVMDEINYLRDELDYMSRRLEGVR